MNKITIQEVSIHGCSSCATAKEILENDIKPAFANVKIEYIDMLSEEGQTMVQKHSIMSSPGVIVNNELFSVGGLDKDKLIKKIKSLS